MRLLVTGGAGFIGSNFVRLALARRDVAQIVNLDLLTYAGNLENLAAVADDPRHRFVRGDICDPAVVGDLMQGIDAVVNFAAESHVDRSLRSAAPFVRTNVAGTETLLAAATASGVGRFLQVSTDEVYGELPWQDPERPAAKASRFREDTPLAPRSPYAATKAAADLLALSFHATHGLDVVVTRSSNTYGPYQFPEKLIPLMVTNALEGRRLPVYGDGLHVRDWLHVEDHCRGILAALAQGASGRVYNLGADTERTNLQVVRAIVRTLDLPDDLIEFVPDRRGHDRRYAVDARRARTELGWRPTTPFDQGLLDTVRWYRDHEAWWHHVRSGAYRRYYEEMYGDRGPHSPGRS